MDLLSRTKKCPFIQIKSIYLLFSIIYYLGATKEETPLLYSSFLNLINVYADGVQHHPPTLLTSTSDPIIK